MRKRRTRSHIIADLSANHFERHALLCGYSVERLVHNYGLELYDASADAAYWLRIQGYFQRQSNFDLTLTGDTITVYLNLSDVVDTNAMRQFARIKAEALARYWRGTNDAD